MKRMLGVVLGLALGVPALADDARVAAAVAHANLRHAQRTNEITVIERAEPGARALTTQIRNAPRGAGGQAAPLTYSEAYRLSLSSGKPLLVWVGGNFCPN